MKIPVTVGRIVYYNLDGKKKLAALVTQIDDEAREEVSLAVFHPGMVEFQHHVSHGPDALDWDWMPFQKDQQARLAPGTPGISVKEPNANFASGMKEAKTEDAE